MGSKLLYALNLFLIVIFGHSCVHSKKLSFPAYYDHKSTIDSIHQSYNILYAKRPFSLEFNDKPFNDISIAIQTDTVKYIYEFMVNEERLADTLKKYDLDFAGIKELIAQMKSVHCTWLNNLVYYDNEKKKMLTYISLRPANINLSMTNSKYFIITFFEQPQYFDSEGNLLVGKEFLNLRKINNEIFRRINDKVCYTVSKKFR